MRVIYKIVKKCTDELHTQEESFEYDKESTAKRNYKKLALTIPGDLIFRQKGDWKHDTLIEKRTYRFCYNATSLVLKKELVIG